jgi:hypothetical protein
MPDGRASSEGGSAEEDAGRRILGDASFGECQAQVTGAEQSIAPVDIVWAIDSSGSMSDEASLVQEQINEFATTIGASGIPYRVVVMTDPSFVTVPPPLGDDPERYRFIDQFVGSNQALQLLVDRYDAYEDFLRRDAIQHFVVVSDDESEDMDHMTFKSMMESMLGKNFNFHAIVSPPGSTHRVMGTFTLEGCSGPRDDAAANGDEYWALAGLTGGQRISICVEDWSVVFDTLSAAIAVPRSVPCVYDVPEPPPGEEFDPFLVNVVVNFGDGRTTTVGFAGSRDECDGDGWYYDDPEDPSRIEMCPATCTRLENDADAEVRIAFGCETLLI